MLIRCYAHASPGTKSQQKGRRNASLVNNANNAHRDETTMHSGAYLAELTLYRFMQPPAKGGAAAIHRYTKQCHSKNRQSATNPSSSTRTLALCLRRIVPNAREPLSTITSGLNFVKAAKAYTIAKDPDTDTLLAMTWCAPPPLGLPCRRCRQEEHWPWHPRTRQLTINAMNPVNET